MEAWREELYHHGILGMKWGSQNGPPYPLGAGDHSVSEKKAGWRKSISTLNRKKNIKRIKKNRINRDYVINKKRRNEEKKLISKYKKNKITTKEYESQLKAINKKAQKSIRRSKSLYKKQIKGINKEHANSLIKVGTSAAAIALTSYGGYMVATGKYSNDDIFFKAGKAMLKAEYKVASTAIKRSTKYGMKWVMSDPASVLWPAAMISAAVVNNVVRSRKDGKQRGTDAK